MKNAAVVLPVVWITRGDTPQRAAGFAWSPVPLRFARLFLQSCLVPWDTGRLPLFISELLCTHHVNAPGLLHSSMVTMVHVICALTTVKFLNLLYDGREEKKFL